MIIILIAVLSILLGANLTLAILDTDNNSLNVIAVVTLAIAVVCNIIKLI